jgi:hypothetical protein
MLAITLDALADTHALLECPALGLTSGMTLDQKKLEVLGIVKACDVALGKFRLGWMSERALISFEVDNGRLEK